MRILIAVKFLQGLLAIAGFVLVYYRDRMAKIRQIVQGVLLGISAVSLLLSIVNGAPGSLGFLILSSIAALLLASSLYVRPLQKYQKYALMGIAVLSLSPLLIPGAISMSSTAGLVGKGATGHVYSGDVGCADGQTAEAGNIPVVSKVAPADEIDHEASILLRFRELDPQGLYHMPMVGEVCDTLPIEAGGGNVPSKRLLLRKGGRVVEDLLKRPALHRPDFKLRRNIPHLVRALMTMERGGIVYDDLAARNIIVGTDDGLWRLIDFGEAKLSDPQIAHDGRAKLRMDMNSLLTEIARVNKADVEWAREYIRQNLPDRK